MCVLVRREGAPKVPTSCRIRGFRRFGLWRGLSGPHTGFWASVLGSGRPDSLGPWSSAGQWVGGLVVVVFGQSLDQFFVWFLSLP